MAIPSAFPFALPGPDGFPLRGDLHQPAGAARPPVLIVHGFKGFKDWGFFPLLAARLAAAGFPACRFNLSGSGLGEDPERFSEPARFERNTYSLEQRDIARMLAALAAGELPGLDGPAPRLGLLGHSRGGGGAILAAARDPRVAALVTWAAIARVDRYDALTVARWRRSGSLRVENARTGDAFALGTELLDDIAANAAALDILAAAGRLQAPTLVVHGEEDESVPVAEGEALAAALGAHGRFLRVAGTGHTFGAGHPLPVPPPASLETVLAATVAHFRAHLA
jgi:pimeloyl-ACP methyl ester carboxylesterase